MASERLSTAQRTLPDFEKPPVVETALGLKFASIPGWNVLHFGRIATRLDSYYPKIELQPPIGQVEFRLGPTQDTFSFPPLRCWFVSSDQSQLVQLQDTLFIRNWRRTPEKTEYEHYDQIRPLFERDWQLFRGFLRDQKLPQPELWQCEVTYINHLVRGSEWNSFEDLQQLFHVWNPLHHPKLLTNIESSSFAITYVLPNDSGRLQFVAQPGLRKSDGKEIVQLSITASGKPASSNDSDIFAWLDAGRAAVVSGFTEFTTDQAHQLWKIKK